MFLVRAVLSQHCHCRQFRDELQQRPAFLGAGINPALNLAFNPLTERSTYVLGLAGDSGKGSGVCQLFGNHIRVRVAVVIIIFQHWPSLLFGYVYSERKFLHFARFRTALRR
jgi:hypothetical protein